MCKELAAKTIKRSVIEMVHALFLRYASITHQCQSDTLNKKTIRMSAEDSVAMVRARYMKDPYHFQLNDGVFQYEVKSIDIQLMRRHRWPNKQKITHTENHHPFETSSQFYRDEMKNCKPSKVICQTV